MLASPLKACLKGLYLEVTQSEMGKLNSKTLEPSVVLFAYRNGPGTEKNPFRDM